MNDYSSNRYVDIKELRGFAGSMFLEIRQHDVAEFLMCLCMKSINLRSVFEHSLVAHTKCLSCGHEVKGESYNNNISILSSPENFTNINLQTIVDRNLNIWGRIGINCGRLLSTEQRKSSICGANFECLGEKSEMVQLSTVNEIIVLQLNLFRMDDNHCNRKQQHFFLHDLSDNPVTINEDVYSIESVILHHGSSIIQGHYTNKLRENNTWTTANDSQINCNSSFTSEGNSYLVILRKMHDGSKPLPTENTESMQYNNDKTYSAVLRSQNRNPIVYRTSPQDSVEIEKLVDLIGTEQKKLIKSRQTSANKQTHTVSIESLPQRCLKLEAKFKRPTAINDKLHVADLGLCSRTTSEKESSHNHENPQPSKGSQLLECQYITKAYRENRPIIREGFSCVTNPMQNLNSEESAGKERKIFSDNYSKNAYATNNPCEISEKMFPSAHQCPDTHANHRSRLVTSDHRDSPSKINLNPAVGARMSYHHAKHSLQNNILDDDSLLRNMCNQSGNNANDVPLHGDNGS
ncbi:hypothetical protein QAD02_021402 [Eretmocerus hayati]|uniref:Uncharacterized protein n=1 Tax=Eretmocerus hayati TaxID=131215 RepID=A0ACC2PSP6_9HYME|nr:hypothetical protein QAD02_021402 [Eretmocerus hayati]